MLEQMVETRKWNAIRGIGDANGKCRLCGQHETVQHLAGCEIPAGVDYLSRHNNALMVLAVNWAIEKGLLSEYGERMEEGTSAQRDRI